MKNVYTNLNDFAEWELEAYADGEDLPHVAAFFEQQPIVWQSWQKTQQLTSRLKTALYRFDCPPPAKLQAYYGQEFSSAEQQQLTAHLNVCPHCAAEVKNLQQFLQTAVPVARDSEPKPAPHSELWEHLQNLAEQMRIVIATLVTPVTPHLAGVALRSDSGAPARQHSEPFTLLYETEEAAISLMVERDVTGARRLSGQLLTTAPTAAGIANLKADQPASTTLQTPIDAIGNFAFEPLHPAHYQVVFTLQSQTILIPNLDLT